MTTQTLPPEVDVLGNIYVHYQTGVKIPIIDQDEDGNPLDISAAPWFFNVQGFRKALDPDPANPTGRLLILTKAEVDAHIPAAGAPFVVTDETDAATPDPRWEGRITPRGWK